MLRKGSIVEYTSLSGDRVRGVIQCMCEGGLICVKVGEQFIYGYAKNFTLIS